MATTAIIAEILIVGLQTLAWVTLTVLAIRPDWSVTTWITRLGSLSLVLALAAAYVLGIVIDRVADSLLDGPGVDAARRRPKKDKGEPSPEKLKLGAKRMAVMAHEKTISPFLEYQRSRLRITRSTCLNLFLAIGPVVAFIVRKGSGWRHEWLPVAGMTLGLLVTLVLTAYSYVRIYRAYLRRLDDAYGEVVEIRGG